MINDFNITQAIKLIENGPDGSRANESAIIKAKNLLRNAARKNRIFASKKPASRVAKIMIDQAQKWEAMSQ